jgi:hypothetical protein
MTRDQALKDLEQRLEKEMGAVGKSYLEKVASLEKRLPAPLWLQLKALPNLPEKEFASKLASSQTQIGLLTHNTNKPQAETPWTEKQRAEARANISQGLPNKKSKRPSINTQVAWWFYDQKRAIPKRAHSISRFRWLLALVLGLVGAFIGWSLAGTVLAAVSCVIWAGLGVWLFGEQTMARVLWVALRLLEILWRLLPVVVLLGVFALVWRVLQ